MRGIFIAAFGVLAFSYAEAGAMDLAEAVRLASEPVERAYNFLHEHPELGKHEVQAHTYLTDALKSFGLIEFVVSTEAPTAVIAILDSGKPGPVIALRAEMDARPLETGMVEPTNHAPRSQIDGLMHSCGHDVHAAILLGTAAILNANKHRFSGKIVFLFQPAEETAGGADDIVREGILGRLGVQKMLAQHVAPGLPIGTITIAPGFALAGSNTFHLKLKGKGSHAAAPSEGTDSPLVAARMALALAEFPARHLDIANKPVVISVTRLLADGNATNVIPADAELHGTIRSFENIDKGDDGQISLNERLGQFVSHMAAQAGVNHEWEIRPGAPPTRNDVALFDQVVRPLSQSWRGILNTSPGRGMFAEDFAYYTQSIPSLYFSLGVAKEGLGKAGVHTKEFDVHPEAFVQGLYLMTSLAVIATTGSMEWN